MYKLMIVDDEAAIREGMMGYDWSRWGFEAVACAPNGRRALEEMRRTPIDLVITDIRMPGMDGLALCREIQAGYPDCLVIILTGYQDFEYAQAAIKAGVLDYLLKPVDMERGGEVFQRAREELDRRLQHRDFMRHAAPIALETLIGNIVGGSSLVDAEVSRALEALGVSLDAPGYNVTCVALPSEILQASAALLQALQEAAQGFFRCFVISVRHTIFVLNLMDSQGIVAQHQALAHQAEALQKAVHGAGNLPGTVFVGVGEVVPVLTQVPRSRQQAVQLVRKAQFADDPSTHTSWQNRQIKADYPGAQEQALIGALQAGEEARAGQCAGDALSALLLHFYALPDTPFVELALTLMRHVDAALAPQGLSFQSVGVDADYAAFLTRYSPFARLRDVLVGKARVLANAVAVRKSEASPTAFRAIAQAKRYIHEHYEEKITLGDMAGRAYLNSSYFSVLFKKETGQNFIDYLTQVRMEQAKKLLADPDVRIYEIGYQVGYPNPRYFSDSFRKHTGLSPQEYRSGLQSGTLREEGAKPPEGGA